MNVKLEEIEIHIPQDTLDKLTQYQRAHNSQSISEAIASSLVEFFKLNINQSCSPSIWEVLIQRFEQVEDTVVHLSNRLERVERFTSISIPAGGYTIKQGAELLSTSSKDCAHSLEALTGGIYVDLSNAEAHQKQLQEDSFNHPNHTNRVINESLVDELAQGAPVEEPALELSLGISSSMLAKRLRTNLTTLRKYLRDQTQTQWVTSRDPDGLSWTYDPRLQRYYPASIGIDSDVASSESVLPVQAQPILYSEEVVTAETDINDVINTDKVLVHPEIGLSQAQLSKLTGIPTNTLQRWKQLPDCTARIQKRTQGKFAYCFCKQYELFYPKPYCCEH